jgi:hypothetical protein
LSGRPSCRDSRRPPASPGRAPPAAAPAAAGGPGTDLTARETEVLELVATAVAGSAFGQTTFGTLSNFDCFNATGGPVPGFEIELEGLTSADVLSTFGAPWNRVRRSDQGGLRRGVFGSEYSRIVSFMYPLRDTLEPLRGRVLLRPPRYIEADVRVDPGRVAAR